MSQEFTRKNNFLGWGLLSQFSPFRYFPKFSALSKHTLIIKHNVHIWQVSPQLSCGDTCQIWTPFKVCNLLFWEIEICRNGEINGRCFSNPRPWSCGAGSWEPSSCMTGTRLPHTVNISALGDLAKRDVQPSAVKWLPFFSRKIPLPARKVSSFYVFDFSHCLCM